MTISEWLGKPGRKPGFSEFTGLDGVELDETGGFTLVAQVEEHMLNPYGIVHGGVIFTLCDNAAGSYMSSRKMYCVTMHSDLSLYKTAGLGDTLRAYVEPRKIGRTVSVLQVELCNQRGERVADGTFHMFRKDPPA